VKSSIVSALVLTAVSVLGSATTAGASTIVFDPTEDIYMSASGTSCSGNVDLDTVSGYNPNVGCFTLGWTFGGIVASGTETTLDVYTKDDESDDSQVDSFTLSFDGTPSGANYSVTNGGSSQLTLTVANSLLADGSLALVLKVNPTPGGNFNDFLFDKSVLTTVVATGGSLPETAPVPEPATLGLLGFGLAAMARKFRPSARG
jgi:hypothetical protein